MNIMHKHIFLNFGVISSINKEMVSIFQLHTYKFGLVYNLKNRPIFIGLGPPRDQSIDCHIHWLARACRCIVVTKIRSIGFPLWKRRN